MAQPVRSVRSSSTRPISRRETPPRWLRGRDGAGVEVDPPAAASAIDNQSFYRRRRGCARCATCCRLGVLDPDAAYDRWEMELELQVSSVSIAARNARAGILEYLQDTFCNLVVLATYPNKALTRWTDASVHSHLLRKGR